MPVTQTATPATLSVTTSAPGTLVVGSNRAALGVLQLTLLEFYVEQQPSTVAVRVGNGTPSGTAYFFIDAESTPVFQAQLDANGGLALVRVPIANRTKAFHLISASMTTVNPGGGASFEVAKAQLSFGGSPADVVPPLLATGGRWAFQAYDFSDLANVANYVFTINPSQASRNFGVITMNHQQTTSADGSVIAWEGAPIPQPWTWTGRVLTQADHDALVLWGQTGQRVWLTDHFGRRYLVKMEGLTMTPRRDVNRPWHHDYQMTALALSGDGVRT